MWWNEEVVWCTSCRELVPHEEVVWWMCGWFRISGKRILFSFLSECLRIKLTESMGGALSSSKKAHLLEASAVRGVALD